MVKIVIATMVKDEDDIIRHWIQYYGKIFGYNNLHIIDNYSSDNTYTICQEYLQKGIHLQRKHDYKKKGTFMTQLKDNIKCDIFIPIDIDEFIVFYDKTDNVINCDNIVTELNTLINKYPNNILFKTEYINPMRTNDSNSILDKFTHGTIGSMNNMAKTFIRNKKNNIKIDHGNHLHQTNVKYIMTNLYLVHYHRRSDVQHKKKVKNNVLGLGYKDNLNVLKRLSKRNVAGIHHIKSYIKMLENPNASNEPSIKPLQSNSIDLSPIKHFLKTSQD